MRILVTNDDGIEAPGLKALKAIAAELSDDVWVVAPETNHSGAGHSLSLRDPIRMRQIDERTYAIGGTPTDCVIMAVRHVMFDHRPDLFRVRLFIIAKMRPEIVQTGREMVEKGELAVVSEIRQDQLFTAIFVTVDDLLDPLPFLHIFQFRDGVLSQCRATAATAVVTGSGIGHGLHQ